MPKHAFSDGQSPSPKGAAPAKLSGYAQGGSTIHPRELTCRHAVQALDDSKPSSARAHGPLTSTA